MEFYAPMHLLAHLNLAGLFQQRKHIMKVLHQKPEEEQLDLIKATCDRFFQFLAKNSVVEISGQEQARELFLRMRREVRIGKIESELMRRVELLAEQEENLFSRRIANSNIQQTVVSIFGLVLASVFGYWGMNLIDANHCCTLRMQGEWGWFAISLVPFGLFFWLLVRFWEQISRRLHIGLSWRASARPSRTNQ